MPKKIKKKDDENIKTEEMKTVILPGEPVKPFNLSMEDKDENARIVLALSSLMTNAGWIFLKQLLEENNRILAEQIIRKMNIDGVPLTEAQADEARYKYSVFNEVIEKPTVMLSKLQRPNDPQFDLDPYDKGKSATGQDINK